MKAFTPIWKRILKEVGIFIVVLIFMLILFMLATDIFSRGALRAN